MMVFGKGKGGGMASFFFLEKCCGDFFGSCRPFVMEEKKIRNSIGSDRNIF
jgi:hypothetical protein